MLLTRSTLPEGMMRGPFMMPFSSSKASNQADIITSPLQAVIKENLKLDESPSNFKIFVLLSGCRVHPSQRIEYVWMRSIQGHEPSSSRMLEIEVGGVKRQSANGVGSCAIILIADNRMTGVA